MQVRLCRAGRLAGGLPALIEAMGMYNGASVGYLSYHMGRVRQASQVRRCARPAEELLVALKQADVDRSRAVAAEIVGILSDVPAEQVRQRRGVTLEV